MEQTECSETSAYKIQTPGNYPEGSIQQQVRCVGTFKTVYFGFPEDAVPALKHYDFVCYV